MAGYLHIINNGHIFGNLLVFNNFSKLIIYVLLILPNIIKSEDIIIPTSLSQDGYFCYLKCSAKCLENVQNLDDCSSNCKHFQDNNPVICQKGDSSCWNLACNYANGTIGSSKTLVVPTAVEANYSALYNYHPRKVLVKWAAVNNAQLYVVEMVEINDSFNTWATGGLNKTITTNTEVVMEKLSLCNTYQFRVAAVNRFEISNFSNIVSVAEPTPIVMNPSLTIEDSVLLAKPYLDHIGSDQVTFPTNGSVHVEVKYNIPVGWSMENREITPVFIPPFLLNCQLKAYSFPTSQPIYNKSFEPYVYFDFPEFVIDKECSFIITLQEIKSQCKTSFKYPPSAGIMFVNFTCNNTRNTSCNHNDRTARGPSCNFEDLTYKLPTDLNDTVLDHSNVSSNVKVNFTWTSRSTAISPVKYYLFDITESVKPLINTFPQNRYPITIRNFSLIKVNESDNWSRDNLSRFTIDGLFELTKYYTVKLCAVYNNISTEPSWDVALPKVVDLTEKIFRNPIDQLRTPIEQNANFTLYLAAGLTAAVALIFLAVAILVVCKMKYCNRKKAIGDYSENRGDYEDRYVNLPRRFDLWELPRQRLIVYEDQKLGSGAFGSVYKGLITGRLLSHRDANSVLAENWMKAENCEVAVKMLPEYADDTSKSEFRREINLMKQIGYHERLVNMLGCITMDEPYCLIVDYCSDGDLLHYLRDRRQYMIKLEAEGININNTSEDEELNYDINMVLCYKDLISFAWQISVGLEYLSQKGYIHRDVAARNVLVDKGKKAKIGDFGLCRYSCSDPIYMGKGGRLPIKWMALEAIKSYEFTVKSDVWSFGVLLFEIITLGGSPYPGIQPSDMQETLEEGKRMEQPDNCMDDLYDMMLETWQADPDRRPIFSALRESLRKMLETVTEDYYYMGLNNARDYYNVVYNDDTTGTKLPSSADSVDEFPSTSGANNNNSSTTSVLDYKQVKPAVKPRTVQRLASRDSSELGSPVNVVKHTDSVNSHELLITPTAVSDKSKFKFFKLNPVSSLENLAESGLSNGSDAAADNPALSYTNNGYLNSG